MDVKEIANVATAAVVQPPPPEAQTHPHQQQQTPGVPPVEVATYALHPVVKVDTDGLVQLQLQDPANGDIVYAVPSEQAARQYRERESNQGKGTAPVEQVAAAAIGGAAATAAAATAIQQPVAAPQQQQAKDKVALPQAVKPVEPQSGSKQSGSVRIKA